ncbi:hypothetical protein [Hydrogenophaga sp. IBVHS2]|uniref:hypothetical protein n=1 Tax=Hydrogenophaga sp. IBVHS2 TaxID=1985170 RepID=UPI001179F339|nr:hypothetical protein [Hydrogenophaga sp. IBVHS2]
MVMLLEGFEIGWGGPASVVEPGRCRWEDFKSYRRPADALMSYIRENIFFNKINNLILQFLNTKIIFLD